MWWVIHNQRPRIPIAADSDRSLTKLGYFITVTLVDRLAADDVTAVVWRRLYDEKKDVLTTLVDNKFFFFFYYYIVV